MKHTISPDRLRLTITANDEDKTALRELGEAIHQDSTMHDFFGPLTCNSGLEWIPEGETGDLTSAPMLGIRESQQTADRENRDAEVLERWAFLDYQVRSVLEDLRDKGEAVFVSHGPLNLREAIFNRFTLELPPDCVKDCSHQGQCDEDVEFWQSRIVRPPEITPEKLAAELKEYGAWDAEELADDAANWRRIIWQAACQIKEETASK